VRATPLRDSTRAQGKSFGAMKGSLLRLLQIALLHILGNYSGGGQEITAIIS